MKQIELSQGLYTLVDDEDYQDLIQYNWYANYNGSANKWVATCKKVGSMHRYLLGVTESDILVRHKNRNGLDNTRENLEVVSRSVSAIKARKKKVNVNKSKFRGVWYDSRISQASHPWRVNILNSYVGAFKSEEEAALAWNDAALEMYGENAQLNII